MVGRKLNDSRGETLVELLASILIAALSVAVLFTCCTAAVEMGKETRAADEAYYEYLSAAEGRTEPAEEGTVKVEGTDQAGTAQEISPEIFIYGGGEMYSYQWKKEADPVGS